MPHKIALVITGALIGLMAISQYQSTPLGPFRDPYQGDADREAIIAGLRVDQEELKKQITSLRGEIRETQKSETTSTEEKIKQLKSLEALNGLTEEQGKGVEILLDDSMVAKRAVLDVNDNSLVHAADLRDLTNLLYAYGATAVAINGERILHSSPVICVGNNILVNDANLLPPFTIQALGPAEKLYFNLLNTEYLPALYGRKEAYGLTFKISIQEDIKIPTYRSNFAVKNLVISDQAVSSQQ